jgi:hypothetical protein
MKIKTLVKSKIEQDYLFVESIIETDVEYLKKKIDMLVSNSNNPIGSIRGLSTDWKAFCDDEIFLRSLFPLFDYLENKIKAKPFMLTEAWGLKEGLGGFTAAHDHFPAYLSGVLYLSDHEQLLNFPEIDRQVQPAAGKLVLFSGFLKHYCDRITENKFKYAISFNFSVQTDGGK